LGLTLIVALGFILRHGVYKDLTKDPEVVILTNDLQDRVSLKTSARLKVEQKSQTASEQKIAEAKPETTGLKKVNLPHSCNYDIDTISNYSFSEIKELVGENGPLISSGCFEDLSELIDNPELFDSIIKVCEQDKVIKRFATARNALSFLKDSDTAKDLIASLDKFETSLLSDQSKCMAFRDRNFLKYSAFALAHNKEIATATSLATRKLLKNVLPDSFKTLMDELEQAVNKEDINARAVLLFLEGLIPTLRDVIMYRTSYIVLTRQDEIAPSKNMSQKILELVSGKKSKPPVAASN
jgi:hypothetical protein